MKRQAEFSSSEDEEGGSEDENAYSRAFRKIVGAPLPAAAESMGPVLAARNKLVAKKLQEQAEKTEKKKSSRIKEEKIHGHVLPEPLSSKERALIKLATKGVVTLFNAVNKAQRIQSGSESLKTSESKAVVKQSKAAFLSEIKKAKTQQDEQQQQTSDEKPGWSVLQDDFMLGRPKLKDWDKQEDVSSSEENDSDSDDD